MTFNGLCDHTRAMPRPVANIVRAGFYVTLRTGLPTFGCTSGSTARFFVATVLPRLATERKIADGRVTRRNKAEHLDANRTHEGH